VQLNKKEMVTLEPEEEEVMELIVRMSNTISSTLANTINLRG